MYCEQTCHHPPVFNYYYKNPNYTAFGYSQMEAIAGANSMYAINKGKFYLKFNDGVLHRYQIPKFTVSGLMIGKRFVNLEGAIVVEDLVIINF